MLLRTLSVVLLLSLAAPGQDTPPGETSQDPREATDTDDPVTPVAPVVPRAGELPIQSLNALRESRRTKQAALEALRARLQPDMPPEERAKIQGEMVALQNEIDRINADFESIATGIDIQAFDLAPPQSFDLQAEVQKLVEPLIKELKDATESTRKNDELNKEKAYLAERQKLALEAEASIEALIADVEPGDPLRTSLEVSLEDWRERIREIEGRLTVIDFQIKRRESQRKSILESTQIALGNFFRTRGLNLIYAIATFFLVLILLRGLYRYVSRALPGGRKEERHFYARLIDVLYYLFVGTFALIASLLVLYASDDWVLLGLTLMFIVGVAWAFKTTIPMFLEQIRLLLNLGTVRERERLLIDGIPYRVSKLSFYTLLSNPDLAGGVRRLPIKDLIDLRSRTCSKDEIWFPCRLGDWVRLSDGRQGAIKHQSPDMVQIEPLGGSRVTYQTSDFLGLAPNNLSHGFRRQVRFGIDYEHQAICTTEAPEIFEGNLRRGLVAQYGQDALTSLKVEFCEAGASSLDYQINADFDGSVAPAYDSIGRAIQRICVETCNEQRWGIPFTQITLHQAS